MIGVYKIYCKGNDQFYIGSSVNIEARWEYHKSQLKRGVHHSLYLQRSYNKYGEDSLIYSVIVELKECNESELRDLEYYYIKKLSPKFNSAAPTECECSQEWKQKISTTISELFKNKNNHPRFHKGKLYNVFDIKGNLVLESKSIQEIGEYFKASKGTFNTMLRKYKGICCSTANNCLIMEVGKTFDDVIDLYKNTLFNSKCPVCDLDGNLYNRGSNYFITSKPHKGRGITFRQIYKQLMNTDKLYITINDKTFTVPYLCHFIQQCISNNT